MGYATGYSYITTGGDKYFVEFGDTTACKTYLIESRNGITVVYNDIKM